MTEKKPLLKQSGLWAAIATAIGTGTALLFGLDTEGTIEALGAIVGGVLTLVSIFISSKVD